MGNVIPMHCTPCRCCGTRAFRPGAFVCVDCFHAAAIDHGKVVCTRHDRRPIIFPSQPRLVLR